MGNKIKLGILGIGNIGSDHVKRVLGGECPEISLAAVCDLKSERLEWANEQAGANLSTFTNAEEMIKSGLIDSFLVAVPHYDHPKYAIMAMEHGLHTLIEKTAGVYTKQVIEMNECAKNHDVVFGIMMNQRTNCIYRKMREIVQSGEMGAIKRTNWIITNWYRKECYYRSNSWRATWSGEGGGVLINQAPHNLDLLTWICGMPESIFAKCDEGKYHNITVEDDATILARYKNGATAAFITSTGEYPGINRFEISGTKGKIVIENGVLTHTSLEIDESYFRSAKNKLSTIQIVDERYDGHINILGNFARAILFGEKLVSPGQEAINELALSNAAYLSSWTGHEISLPLDDELFEEILFTKAKAENTTARKDERENLQFGYKERWNTKW